MKENIFRGVIAAAVAGAAAYFQELALPVVVLFLVMVVDYVSGMVRAWTRGELCSRVGIMGIVKKAAYLLAASWRLWPIGWYRRRRARSGSISADSSFSGSS